MKILRLLFTLIFYSVFVAVGHVQAMDVSVPASVSGPSEPLLAQTEDNSLSLAQRLYPEYKTDFEELRSQVFLPTDPEGAQSKKLYLLQLCHLAQIKSNNNKQPLDQKTIQIIARSRSADTTNAGCLKIAPWLLAPLGCCSLLALGALCPVPTAVKTTCIVTGAITGCAATGASGVYGWYTTGYLPDKASNAANTKQNSLANLNLVYPELARELIDLHFSKDKDKQKFAKKIAEEMNVKHIRKILKERLDFHEEVPHPVFNELGSAVSYVNTEVLPPEHGLKHYIQSQTLPTPPPQPHLPTLH